MWIWVFCAFIVAVMLGVNLSGVFGIGFFIAAVFFIALFSQRSRQNEIIEKLEQSNRRIILRLDALIERFDEHFDDKKIAMPLDCVEKRANLAQDLATKKAEFHAHIAESKSAESKFESIKSTESKSLDSLKPAESTQKSLESLESSESSGESNIIKSTAESIESIANAKDSQELSTDLKNAQDLKDSHESTKDSQDLRPAMSKILQDSRESTKDSRKFSQDLIQDLLQKSAQKSTKDSQDSRPKSAPKATKHINLSTIERFLAQKAMIILGGIFFVLAAYFCIKYSIEHNLITPQLRIAGACAFGVLLFALGFAFDSLKRADLGESNTQDSPKVSRATNRPFFTRLAQKIVRILSLSPQMSARIAQTLIGTSIVVEFFSIYGGYALYEFFGNALGFALLCAVSFGALFLTLRFGLIVGIFGLLGGFATPFLISTQNPNFYLLCGYLIILHNCVLYIWRKNSAIIPLLSSGAVLVYMAIFVNKASATTPLGESTFAFIVICVVFFTLFMLSGRVFDKKIDELDNSFAIYILLFVIVGVLGFATLLNLSSPEKIASPLFGFGFIALLCGVSAFAPLLGKIDSNKFSRFFDISESLKKPEILECGVAFALILGSVYLGAFVGALPNYCIIILEAIFVGAFVANALFMENRAFYLTLMLVSSVIFGLIEFCQTALMFSNVAVFFICAFIYGAIVAKKLPDSKAINALLSLNALVFFGAIVLFAKNLDILTTAMRYFYLFCAMWVLAFSLLCVPQILRFKGKEIRLRKVPDLAFMGVGFFAIAGFIFLNGFGLALFHNLFFNPEFATLGLKTYCIFAFACGVSLLLLARYSAMQKDSSDNYGIFALSHKDFFTFCNGFKRVIFAVLLVLIMAIVGAIIARIYYAMDLKEVAFIAESLYFIAGAGIFGILAILCAKLNGALDSNANLANFATKLGVNRTKALKYAFVLMGAKSLWFYIIALGGWIGVFFGTIDYVSQAQFYYLAHTIFAYSTLSLVGFVLLFALNGEIAKITANKFLRYAVDFIAIALLICAVIGVIHCALGVNGDIVFDDGFTYKFATNGANELYAYSAGLVCVSVALLIIGIKWQVERFKHYCFALLCATALKVFFIDTASFSSLGKVALFVFMGVAFIGIAVIYNKFVLKREV